MSHGPLMALLSSMPVPGGVSRAVKRTLFTVGYYHQRLSQLDFGGVAILCYHGIPGAADAGIPFGNLHVRRETFERHCRLIAETCHPISLDDFRAALNGRRALPSRPVIVTFDDGYRSVLEHALPSLERHGVPAAVFVCVEPTLQSRHYWFDTLWRRGGEEAVCQAKTLPYGEWRALRDSIATPFRLDERHRPMTAGELLRLSASPLIEIGGHTVRHPVLALAPLDEQRLEVGECRTTLRDVIGKPVNAFAYPFGEAGGHYRPETVDAVRDAGFDLAFTTRPSFAIGADNTREIPRFIMLDSVDDAELAHRLVHSWHPAGHV